MEIKDLILNQKAFFATNESKNISFRIEQLKKLQSLLKKNEKQLYDAIQKDFGKSEFETYLSELSLIYHELLCHFSENIQNIVHF